MAVFCILHNDTFLFVNIFSSFCWLKRLDYCLGALTNTGLMAGGGKGRKVIILNCQDPDAAVQLDYCPLLLITPR